MKNEQKIEILKQALYHIKDHQDIVMKGAGNLSATWNIANNALIDAGINPLTDNDRKAGIK
jgi:hypothetical protein